LIISDYQAFGELINGSGDQPGLWDHAVDMIAEGSKDDVIAYIDNTSQQSWQERIDAKLGAGVVAVGDFSQDQNVKLAEQQIFQREYAEKFSGLGELGEIKASDESAGVLEVAGAKFEVAAGQIVALDGEKLTTPIALDDNAFDKVMTVKLGFDSGLKLSDLREMGIVSKDDLTVTNVEKNFLTALTKTNFITNQKFGEFKHDFQSADFVRQGEFEPKIMDFVLDQYQDGQSINKEVFVKAVDNWESINRNLQSNLDLAATYELTANSEIHINTAAEYNGHPAVEITKEGAVQIGNERGPATLMLTADGRVIYESAGNNPLFVKFMNNDYAAQAAPNSENQITLMKDPAVVLTDPAALQETINKLVSANQITANLAEKIDQSVAERGFFEKLRGIEPEYKGRMLAVPAAALSSEKNFVEAVQSACQGSEQPEGFGPVPFSRAVQGDNLGRVYETMLSSGVPTASKRAVLIYINTYSRK
jgi:hypothetical protein